jgi:ankyrin repeat protein
MEFPFLRLLWKAESFDSASTQPILNPSTFATGGPRHTEIVQLLVQHGANVNLADASGVTPLTHARQRGYAEITMILQQAGAR